MCILPLNPTAAPKERFALPVMIAVTASLLSISMCARLHLAFTYTTSLALINKPASLSSLLCRHETRPRSRGSPTGELKLRSFCPQSRGLLRISYSGTDLDSKGTHMPNQQFHDKLTEAGLVLSNKRIVFSSVNSLLS